MLHSNTTNKNERAYPCGHAPRRLTRVRGRDTASSDPSVCPKAERSAAMLCNAFARPLSTTTFGAPKTNTAARPTSATGRTTTSCSIWRFKNSGPDRRGWHGRPGTTPVACRRTDCQFPSLTRCVVNRNAALSATVSGSAGFSVRQAPCRAGRRRSLDYFGRNAKSAIANGFTSTSRSLSTYRACDTLARNTPAVMLGSNP